MEARSPTGGRDKDEMDNYRETTLGFVCVDPSARPLELSLPSFGNSHRETTLSYFILGKNMRSKVEHADAGTIPKVYIYYCNAGMHRMCLESWIADIFNLYQANEQQNKQQNLTFVVISSNSDIKYFYNIVGFDFLFWYIFKCWLNRFKGLIRFYISEWEESKKTLSQIS